MSHIPGIFKAERLNYRKILVVGLIIVFLTSMISITPTLGDSVSNPTLANTIKNLVSNTNFTKDLDTAYMGLSIGTVTPQEFQTMIDALPSSDWNSIMYWYAVVDKYNLANQTTIERALDAASLMANDLPAEFYDLQGLQCFCVYDRYLIYGYYWAAKYQYDLSKWNITLAYNSYDTAVKYSQASYGTPPLWIRGDNTASPYTGRYYDETGQSLDGYLEFYRFGISQALNRSVDLWNFENAHYWNGAYYGYTSANGLYECEAGGFEQIIWKLYNYDSNITNTQNLLTDIHSRYLASLWNSPQWLDYVVQHADSNSQRRLENTQMTWQSIIATYPLLPPSDQNKIQEMLNGAAYNITTGSNLNIPAWSLLSDPSAGLYDQSTGLYRIRSDAVPSDSATALAANLLINLAIIQTTAKLAVPLEELHYEYNYNIIDKDLTAIDFSSNSVLIPIAATGNLTFLYGSTPLSLYFNKIGVWNVTFASDWNSVVDANFLGQLPTNRIYMYTGNSQHESPLNYTYTEKGFPLSINVPVQNGSNTIQIYANDKLEYNDTVVISDNSSNAISQIDTSNLSVGNYTITASINSKNTTIEMAEITYLGDLNGEFKVDGHDFISFAGAYVGFNRVNLSVYNGLADFNQDGKITSKDFIVFMNSYISYNSPS